MLCPKRHYIYIYVYIYMYHQTNQMHALRPGYFEPEPCCPIVERRQGQRGVAMYCPIFFELKELDIDITSRFAAKQSKSRANAMPWTTSDPLGRLLDKYSTDLSALTSLIPWQANITLNTNCSVHLMLNIKTGHVCSSTHIHWLHVRDFRMIKTKHIQTSVLVEDLHPIPPKTLRFSCRLFFSITLEGHLGTGLPPTVGMLVWRHVAEVIVRSRSK